MKNLIKKICLFNYAAILRFSQFYMRNFKSEELAQIVCLTGLSTEEWIELELQDKEMELNQKLNIQ